MMEPVHQPGEPFVRPRRPKPLAVTVFLAIAILLILAIGVVIVLVWNALLAEEQGVGVGRALTPPLVLRTLSA
jgi:hypothetical protein